MCGSFSKVCTMARQGSTVACCAYACMHAPARQKRRRRRRLCTRTRKHARPHTTTTQTLPVQLLTMMGGRCEGALLEGASGEASCAEEDAEAEQHFLHSLARHRTLAAAAPTTAAALRSRDAGAVGCCQCSDPVNDIGELKGWAALAKKRVGASAMGGGFVRFVVACVVSGGCCVYDQL